MGRGRGRGSGGNWDGGQGPDQSLRSCVQKAGLVPGGNWEPVRVPVRVTGLFLKFRLVTLARVGREHSQGGGRRLGGQCRDGQLQRPRTTRTGMGGSRASTALWEGGENSHLWRVCPSWIG